VLGQVEDAAERGLHIVRGLLWAVLTLLFWVIYGLAGTLPLALVVLVTPFGVVVWELLRRLIWSPVKRRWLKYVLIVLDGWVILRPVTFILAYGTAVERLLGELKITRAEIDAVLPPLLVYLALSGAFRLDPRAAAASTLVALLGFAYTAHVGAIPTREALAIACVIGFSGVVGIQIARVLRVVALRAREEEVLEHYVPQTLTQELARSGDPDRAGRQEAVTVLIADIRGFTHLSERLTPAAAVALLNDYFAVVVAPLAAEDAVLDGYSGDGLLAFFEGAEQPARALRAANGMRAALARFNASRAEAPPLRIGIAIHAGEVLVGTIGAPVRREYTIIGDVVNVTDRLEKSNKAFDSVVVASGTVLANVSHPAALGFRGPQLIHVRGRNEPIAVYHLPHDAPIDTTKTA
jgi:class 3 adenylate cyclase